MAWPMRSRRAPLQRGARRMQGHQSRDGRRCLCLGAVGGPCARTALEQRQRGSCRHHAPGEGLAAPPSRRRVVHVPVCESAMVGLVIVEDDDVDVTRIARDVQAGAVDTQREPSRRRRSLCPALARATELPPLRCWRASRRGVGRWRAVTAPGRRNLRRSVGPEGHCTRPARRPVAAASGPDPSQGTVTSLACRSALRSWCVKAEQARNVCRADAETSDSAGGSAKGDGWRVPWTERVRRATLWTVLLAVALRYGHGHRCGCAAGRIQRKLLPGGLLAWALEKRWPHEPHWLADDGQMLPDLLHTPLAEGLVQVLALVSIVLGVTGDVAAGPWWPSLWSLLAQVALVLVVAELGLYTSHRLAHEWPPLWRFHAVHHSVRRLGFWNTGRFHAVDTLSRTAASVSLLWLAVAKAGLLQWISAVEHSSAFSRMPTSTRAAAQSTTSSTRRSCTAGTILVGPRRAIGTTARTSSWGT
jgi:hypothetical protein